MNHPMEKLVRPGILALAPYRSARDEFGSTADVFLDANENSLGDPWGDGLHRYPDSGQGTLKAAVARRKGVLPEQIFLGNGSDEAIDLLLRVFCEPGLDNVIILPPTYGMYAVQAGIHGAELRQAPLRPDFSPNPPAVRAVTDARSKLLFLCSPNNPTGQCLPEDFILDMLGDFPGLVVIDEAYVDFARQPTWLDRLNDFPNLVVLQTLSKAWGLAALRVGMAFSGAFVNGVLNKIKYPYNLGAPAINIALKALENESVVQEKVNTLLAERRRLVLRLPELACVQEVFPSDANFLLVRVADAEGIYRYLLEQSIVVRNRHRERHCENCLRITVGTAEENDRLLNALKHYPA